jgi:hypothetical protein
VHTGHGPLDLDHLVKRVCAEVEAEDIGLRAMGLCYLELNAVLGTGLGTDWPVAVDHGSTMETSWMSALEPDLVSIERLPDDPAAAIVGVYANPGSLSAETGGPDRGRRHTRQAAAALCGEPVDAFADLRTFVARYWPERLVLSGRAADPRRDPRHESRPSRATCPDWAPADGVPIAASDLSLARRRGDRHPDAGRLACPSAGSTSAVSQTAEIGLPDAIVPGPTRSISSEPPASPMSRTPRRSTR